MRRPGGRLLRAGRIAGTPSSAMTAVSDRVSPTATVRRRPSGSSMVGASFSISGAPPPARFMATTCSSMICSGTSQPTARSVRPWAVTVHTNSRSPQSAGTVTCQAKRWRRG